MTTVHGQGHPCKLAVILIFLYSKTCISGSAVAAEERAKWPPTWEEQALGKQVGEAPAPVPA